MDVKHAGRHSEYRLDEHSKMHFDLWIPRIFCDRFPYYFVQFKAHILGVAIPFPTSIHLGVPFSAICTVAFSLTPKDAATKQESMWQPYRFTV